MIRSAAVVLLALAGCSEWSLRSMFGSSPVASDTGFDGPGAPDTAPPEGKGGAGSTLPTHCIPVGNPPLLPVWDYDAEEPLHYPHASLASGADFDAAGRVLWTYQGHVLAADRSGSVESLSEDEEHPVGSFIRLFPNGKMVRASGNRVTVMDPDTGQSFFEWNDAEVDLRMLQFSTLEVDTENHLYLRVEGGDIIRMPSSGGTGDYVVFRPDWDPEGEWVRQLNLALSPDERILYVLATYNVGGKYIEHRLLRAERDEEGWMPPVHVWTAPVHADATDVVADECGNAIVLLGGQMVQGFTLWYFPRKGRESVFFHDEQNHARHIQWGSGRFGWDASTLYLWIEHFEAPSRLHKLEVGVKGNHVLTR